MIWCSLDQDALSSNFRNDVPERIGIMQMLITVPKKKRRRAVDRVLMRRRIREAYRLNRASLRQIVENNPSVRSLEIAFIYIHDENLSYAYIERKMKILLGKLETKLNNNIIAT